MAGEELEHGVGPDVRPGQHCVLHPSHRVPQFQSVRLFPFQGFGKAALVAQVPHVKHLGVDVGENLGQVIVADYVQPQVGRVGPVKVVADLGRGDSSGWRGSFRCFPGLGFLQQLVRLGFNVFRQFLPLVGVLQGVGQGQAAHGILGVGHHSRVFRGDA